MIEQTKILIIGANGQLGTELTTALQDKYRYKQVITSDIHSPKKQDALFETLDIRDKGRLEELIEKYKFTDVYLLAAILSAKGEQNPMLTWQVNMDGLMNVLELARDGKISKVFWPSSIAVFGETTPKQQTPQETITSPTTMYGISKLAGERLCAYYANKLGVDVRSLRYPGLIGYKALPGGGTTDFAVEIYHKALESSIYHCFLRKDSILPLMYMPDAVRATIELMEADAEKISVRSSYNLAGFSCSPADIAEVIQQRIPDFKIDYQPDFRQKIADSWPNSIDDSQAKEDWGWKPQYDLQAMSDDMLSNLKRLKEKETAINLS
ncbi:NAD-dependent epimerase/dehydratase family protein [Catalinimonas niigatensis]|uniref:NAD-dependent epimerase/dehydratase family protein n=1 Tax=Catalinimonas niigatensis TaxID=1397264 RepID=UPI0026668702|nr:NAD-dependent epimerase/dehydratase family protein [Catalinimonas niigatensis]WPP53358.1 NAD-dependent epimerase/dehydratase family protein [Catalinimonas niigatensis]